ncbi:hypothetical protein NKI12_16075, partial [Mesorhizobium australicum]|uniref:hypothetical protein n=1 Tax=Mesorhizobium australicum TaxID=536018 RepID=UPI003335C7BB
MIAESDSQRADAGDDIDAVSAQLPVSARGVLAAPPRGPAEPTAHRAGRPGRPLGWGLLGGGRA